MADKLAANPPEPAIGNVTDATRREAFWACVKTANALATAQANHRNELKKWKSNGVDPAEITLALKARKKDQGDLLQGLRGQARMLMASGVLPELREQLFAGFGDYAPPTAKETGQIEAHKAADEGYFAGKDGDRRDSNPHAPGTDLHVEWDHGWIEGQAAIAMRMGAGGEAAREAAGSVMTAQPRGQRRRRTGA